MSGNDAVSPGSSKFTSSSLANKGSTTGSQLLTSFEKNKPKKNKQTKKQSTRLDDPVF